MSWSEFSSLAPGRQLGIFSFVLHQSPAHVHRCWMRSTCTFSSVTPLCVACQPGEGLARGGLCILQAPAWVSESERVANDTGAGGTLLFCLSAFKLTNGRGGGEGKRTKLLGSVGWIYGLWLMFIIYSPIALRLSYLFFLIISLSLSCPFRSPIVKFYLQNGT